MIIKEVYVEIALSKNFQKYTVGMTAKIMNDENVDVVTKELQAKCRKHCKEQIDIDSVTQKILK